MLYLATILIMLAGAWTQYRNGLFSSIAMLVMVFISGLIAFNFWEPIADFLDPTFQNNALAGAEDMIALVVLFSLSLFLLRLAISYLNPDMIDEHGTLQYVGAAAVGLVTGYFVAGFLVCTMQTLPLDERFMDFEPRVPSEPGYRSVLPPDRVWLTMMRHAGAAPLSWKVDDPDAFQREDRFATFDRDGTFELRYLRYRRNTESREKMPYLGEFDRELGREKGRKGERDKGRRED
jgi:uncharacterized membrane protein required for colicin V production